MGPKVEAARRFALAARRLAVIGSLADAGAMLRGEAGTRVAVPGATQLALDPEVLVGAAG